MCQEDLCVFVVMNSILLKLACQLLLTTAYNCYARNSRQRYIIFELLLSLEQKEVNGGASALKRRLRSKHARRACCLTA